MAGAKTTIKFYEVINWLFSPEPEVPENFILYKTKLNNIVPYINEQLWTNPKLSWYLNKHTNDLYNIPDPIEMLELLKKLIINYKITQADLWTYYPEHNPDLIKEIQERDKLGENDARGKLLLAQHQNIDMTNYIKISPTKRNLVLNDSQLQAQVKQVLKNHTEKKKEEQLNSSRFIKHLDQKVIEDMGLILFDVSLLKKSNRTLLTFIDKDNSKKYFMTPFTSSIYLSKKEGVINNDYIEEINENFNHYYITDIKLYTKLKYSLNKSYERLVNGI